METRIDEVAAGIYRLSTFVPQVAAPLGFTFNQFLMVAEEPLLFHCGHRRMFPLIAEAVARVLPPQQLRWLSFGHIEADECGAMNEWLAAVPHATVAHGAVASRVSLDDMADQPPRTLADGEVIDLGGKRVRYIDTPHVPHGWEAGVLFEETTGTLLCGDLFSHPGNGPALVFSDVVEPAMAAEDMFGYSSLTPATGPTIRRLADLAPGTLALMHGSSFSGNGTQALRDLADRYDQRVRAALA
jgi:flavorubredoxin